MWRRVRNSLATQVLIFLTDTGITVNDNVDVGVQLRTHLSHLDESGGGAGGSGDGLAPGVRRHQGAEGPLGLREADRGRLVGNGLEVCLSLGLLKLLHGILGAPDPCLGGGSAPEPVVKPHHDHNHHQVETRHNLIREWVVIIWSWKRRNFYQLLSCWLNQGKKTYLMK